MKASKYKTTPQIEQEFVDFLKHYRKNDALTEEEIRAIVRDYFKEKDIALSGQIRKIHGANTRNATKELIWVILATVIGIILSIIAAPYIGEFLDSFIKR